jgi:quinone-modifying oxidoreductase subunit QmoB
MADKKIAVYISSAFGIGEAIDCKKLQEDVEKIENVELVKVRKNLFTPDGVEEIKNDIKELELNGFVVAGPSPRYYTELFDQFQDIVFERVNLREHVAWLQEPNNEHTYNLALDYMKMGVAKVRLIEIPEPAVLDINDTIMVVGGGITGMTSALSAADTGYNVVLCEKETELGGFMRKMHRLTPTKAPYYELEQNVVEKHIADVMAHEKIKVLLDCTIESTNGQPGIFDVKATLGGETMEFQVGAIIQASGWRPYDANKLDHLGYGKYQNVVTNVEMETLAKEDNLKRPSDGGEIKSVTFVQCAGSRDKDHLPYCSGVCCNVSLKQAMYVREKYPDAAVYIIYKDMRTMGNNEKFYKKVQNESNIFLSKGEIASIEESEAGKLLVNVDDTLLGENMEIESDLVVLATGLVPNSAPEKVPEIKEGEEETATIDPPKILQLKYLQGPELPELHYGYPDSHYICFPYETRRTGIYVAGTARNPMDTVQAKNDSMGASLKAIQALESTRRGTAVHPRAGDKTFPDFFLQRCTQCKRCTEECPFGTLEEDIKGTPKPNPNRCRRCGICMGACPERIISFKNYSVQIISSIIKSIYIPTEEEDNEATPRIIAFMCENDAYPSLDVAARNGVKISPHIRVIPVRCLGSVSTSWIADALSQGFDGAILFGCKYGEDYQCHFIRGSELANKRMENVQEKLKQLVLEPERVELHMLSIDEYHEMPNILNKFAEVIEEIGPNPYKEM